MLELVEGRAAHRGLAQFERQVQRLEHALGLLDDFRADAIAGEDCDLMSHEKFL